MLQGLTGWHLVLVLAIVLLLFGAPRLPALARSIGQSMKIFRSEVKTDPKTTDTTTPGETSDVVETPAPKKTES